MKTKTIRVSHKDLRERILKLRYKPVKVHDHSLPPLTYGNIVLQEFSDNK